MGLKNNLFLFQNIKTKYSFILCSLARFSNIWVILFLREGESEKQEDSRKRKKKNEAGQNNETIVDEEEMVAENDEKMVGGIEVIAGGSAMVARGKMGSEEEIN